MTGPVPESPEVGAGIARYHVTRGGDPVSTARRNPGLTLGIRVNNAGFVGNGQQMAGDPGPVDVTKLRFLTLTLMPRRAVLTMAAGMQARQAADP